MGVLMYFVCRKEAAKLTQQLPKSPGKIPPRTFKQDPTKPTDVEWVDPTTGRATFYDPDTGVSVSYGPAAQDKDSKSLVTGKVGVKDAVGGKFKSEYFEEYVV